jgi:beta-lactamase class A
MSDRILVTALKRTFVLAFLIVAAQLCSGQAAAPKSAPVGRDKQKLLWNQMEKNIQRIVGELDGFAGVAIVDLTSGEKFFINADEVFPQASLIKLPMLVELYRQEEQAQKGASGKARLTDLYTVRKEDMVPDSDVMLGLTPGVTRVTNRDLATMAASVSDNAATNVLIDRVGMENVNAMLDGLGLSRTRLRRKMMDLKAAQEGRENISTPREMVTLLESVWQNKLFTQALRDDLVKVLSSYHTHYTTFFHGAVPAEVVVAEKEGELEAVRTDAGIVFAQNRPFAIAVMTTFLDNEKDGEAAIGKIAGIAYRYFDRVGRASEYGRVISPRTSK